MWLCSQGVADEPYTQAELLTSLKECKTEAEAHVIVRQLVSVYEMEPLEMDVILGNHANRRVWFYATELEPDQAWVDIRDDAEYVLQIFVGTRAKFVTDILDPLHVDYSFMMEYRLGYCGFKHKLITKKTSSE